MKLLSITEAAARLGYHPQHLRRLIRDGKVKPPIRLVEGGRPLIPDEDIDELIAKRIAERDGAK